MATFRKLPSGKWQALVKLPNGRQVTKTHLLKKVVSAWAAERERERDRGEDIFDGRVARRTTLDEWHKKWLRTLTIEPHTIATYASVWRVHAGPRIGKESVAIDSVSIKQWQAELVADGVGSRQRTVALTVLSQMLQLAVESAPPMLTVNPCRLVDRPAQPIGRERWLEHEEDVRLLAGFSRDGDRAMAELMLDTGLRWGEAAGLRGDAVDWLRGTLQVRGVLPQSGPWRSYPKSKMSNRTLPVSKPVLDQLARQMDSRPRSELVFVTDRGSRLHYRNWLRDAWQPAIEAAGLAVAQPAEGKRRKEEVTPHVLRHTFATRMARAGVDFRRLQKLMGHESYKTTERYDHHRSEAFDGVRAAQEASRAARPAGAPMALVTALPTADGASRVHGVQS